MKLTLCLLIASICFGCCASMSSTNPAFEEDVTQSLEDELNNMTDEEWKQWKMDNLEFLMKSPLRGISSSFMPLEQSPVEKRIMMAKMRNHIRKLKQLLHQKQQASYKPYRLFDILVN